MVHIEGGEAYGAGYHDKGGDVIIVSGKSYEGSGGDLLLSSGKSTETSSGAVSIRSEDAGKDGVKCGLCNASRYLVVINIYHMILDSIILGNWGHIDLNWLSFYCEYWQENG